MNKKIWRVNYVITYYDKSVVIRERNGLHALLKTVARLQKIEIAIKEDNAFESDQDYKNNTVFANSVTDLVYFRSLPNAAILPKDFRKMIHLIFSNHQWITYTDQFSVQQQLLKALPQYPFPEK